MHLDDGAGAFECYGRAVHYRPLLGQAWFNRGLTLLELDRPLEAIASLERAVELAGPADSWGADATRALSIAREFQAEAP